MVDKLNEAIRDLRAAMRAKGWTHVEIEVDHRAALVRGVSPTGPDVHRRQAATAEASVRSLTEYFQSKTYAS